MRIVVTGADGFVGRRLVAFLTEGGHQVVAAIRRGLELEPALRECAADVCELELTDPDSITVVGATQCDAVVHLAAVASGNDARRDPGLAWTVNAVGTALLAESLAAACERGANPMLLVASTGEVYGNGPAGPRKETDDPAPCSPYAASKLAGEIAALEVHRRTGLRVVVTRAFPHTGAGHDTRFAIPAFAQRILTAKRIGAPGVKVGNLTPVRDITHVSDVMAAYTALLEHGDSGSVYNVASGTGQSLADVFRMLTELAGHPAVPETDARFVRTADIEHLVGDASKLREATGWVPAWSLRDTLAEVLDAQTN